MLYSSGPGLASHFGVQAMVAGIPFITSFYPSPGSTLVAKPGFSVVEQGDIDEIRRQLVLGGAKEPPKYVFNMVKVPPAHSDFPWHLQAVCSRAAAISLLMAHHGMTMNYTGVNECVARIMAHSICLFIRLCAATCAGELRHWGDTGPGGKKNLGPKVKKKTKLPSTPRFIYGRTSTTNRAAVYLRLVGAKWDAVKSVIETAPYDFAAEGWNGSFGGPAWARCAQAVKDMLIALENFESNPSVDSFKELVSRWHTAINIQHNSHDTMLGKFFQDCEFAWAECNPLYLLLNPEAPYLLLQMAGLHIPKMNGA